jgi:protein-tyrosine phosphatase
MSATEMLPNLWITDVKMALNQRFLRDNQIEVAINCTKDRPFSSKEGLVCHRLPINDTGQYHDTVNLYQYLPKITSVLGKYYYQRQPIIVYCEDGRQRAPTVIAAFIMRFLGMDWPNAVKMIQSKRGSSFNPEINFAEALKSFNHLYGSGKVDKLE